jgi:hypothetical protein
LQFFVISRVFLITTGFQTREELHARAELLNAGS